MRESLCKLRLQSNAMTNEDERLDYRGCKHHVNDGQKVPPSLDKNHTSVWSNCTGLIHFCGSVGCLHKIMFVCP